jgi:formylglycine-generating enzyme required for sulfatase activity
MNAVAMMRSIVVILGLAGLAACAHSAAPGEAFRDCTLCPEMVMMPTDAFAMGAPEAVANATGGGPMFAVSRTEVTFAQWDACVAARGCDGYRPSDLGWGRGNRPVINVTWNNAQAYVRWLSRRTRHAYRLLSSAEWEIAARALDDDFFVGG